MAISLALVPVEWLKLKMIVDFEKSGQLTIDSLGSCLAGRQPFLEAYKVEKYFPCGCKTKRRWESRQ